MSENTRLKVAFLWHMHQPFYLHPRNNQLMMPWVRFHGLKDYLDMPLMAAKHEKLRVTFNLVPSLLDQIQMYCDGFCDRHLELSKIPARHLSTEEKKEILKTFFSAHQPTMIDPYARYRQLLRKKEGAGDNLGLAVETFSTSEWRDLQVWSNMVWIDPMFRNDGAVHELFEKGRDFTEEEKERLLAFQIDLLRRIIPTYQKLFQEGKIDISFTPYYHPILPLLVDTGSAREAMPQMELPVNRFCHPEDARWQVEESVAKFRSLFGKNPRGMWPSEGSVSEEVLKIISAAGLNWTATDQDVLHHSLIKSGQDPRRYSPHTAYIFKGAPATKLFFRDRGLSDKIGFVYSSWDADRAVNDFIQHLRRLREFLKGDLKNCVVPVILDGENAWEYYPEDGGKFLEKLYAALTTEEQLETVFLSEAAEIIEPLGLDAVMAGSWINHNFRIWIGHPEDNAAWDMLFAARKVLTEYQQRNPNADQTRMAEAWKQIHIAEGSDWCWWYGDEHQGANNEQFDQLFRLLITSVYELIGMTPPLSLSKPLHKEKLESYLTLPESLVTPRIDGLLTHYYEWSGAGHYDCLKSGGAMHRMDRIINDIYFAFDYDNFYIRLDFVRKFDLVVGIKNSRVVIDFRNIASKEILLEKGILKDCGDYKYSFNHMLEIQFDRSALLKEGSGTVEFQVVFYSGNEMIEKWPVDDPIVVEIPEKDREIFWQV